MRPLFYVLLAGFKSVPSKDLVKAPSSMVQEWSQLMEKTNKGNTMTIRCEPRGINRQEKRNEGDKDE